MKAIHMISFILLVAGGLNWGLIGIGAGDIVTRLVGYRLADIVFILVGVAAVILVVTHKKTCRMCTAGMSS